MPVSYGKGETDLCIIEILVSRIIEIIPYNSSHKEGTAPGGKGLREKSSGTINVRDS